MSGRTGLLLCAGALFLSSPGLFEGEARAAPLTVTLEYAAGPGCPDAAAFKAVVIARLGHDPFTESAPHHVLVSIQPRGRVVDGRIEWRDPTGKWTGDQMFPSVTTECLRLARAMGLALAIQIQLLAKASAPGDEQVEAPVEPAFPPPPPTVRPIATPPLSPEAPTVPRVADTAHAPTGGLRPVFAMGAGPSVGFGISAAPVLLGRLFGAVAWRHLSVELSAAVSLPATIRRPDGAGFSQQHLLGSAGACATVARWSSCLVANAGEVRMTGRNIDRSTSASVSVVQAGVRAGAIQHLGRRAFLNAHAEGLINLTRWTATLDQVPVWTASRFAAAFGVDAGVRFP